MFQDVNLPKHIEKLKNTFHQRPLNIVNANIIFGHVFSNLQNCPITINIDTPPSSLIDSTTIPKWKHRKDKKLGYTPWFIALQG